MSPRPELPDKQTMCHRTGFTKTCFECVVQHGCRLWKHVRLEGDPDSPQGTCIPVDRWDCMDSLADLYSKDLLRRQTQTTATVDKLSKVVADANDQQMVGAIARLNQQMDEARGAIAGPAPLTLPAPRQ